MKKLLTFIFIFAAVCLRAQDVTGFWKTYDEKTKEPKSVVALYERNGQIYGKVILTYVPGSKGQTVKDNMYLKKHKAAENIKTRGKDGKEVTADTCGFDFIRGIQKSGGKDWLYENGLIVDPQSGSDYLAKIKLDKDGNLVLKGTLKTLKFLGRSQTWTKFDPANFPEGFAVPDYKNFTPVLPVIK